MFAYLLIAGCGGPASDTEAVQGPDTVDTDDSGDTAEPDDAPVVVVGAGIAGLAAAGSHGSALVLEADAVVGGRALWSGGAMQFVDIPPQADLEFVDSPERAAADWEALTGAPPSDTTLRYLADSAATYTRLLAAGVEFLPELAREPRTDAPRILTVEGGGAALVEALVSALPDTVEVRLSTPVAGLLWRDGRVVGVQTAEGEIAASEVVIASGGFAGDVARLSEVAVADAWEASNHGGAGDALDWAEADGLATSGLTHVGWFTRRVGAAADNGGLVALERLTWVWVDSSGARFVDEAHLESVTLTGPLRAAGTVWAISSRAEAEAAVKDADAAAFAAAIDADDQVRCRSDAGALAQAIEVDGAGLAATVAAVDTILRGGQDPLGRLASTFAPLSGELCAWHPGESASKTYGGLDVDADGRVLDADGDVVPGLWAVGEAAGMGGPGLAGTYGFDGTLSAVVWSGWRVGDRLAAPP